MGRRNTRGLELSFKPLAGGRGRGRWYKKICGRAHYFGWGQGVSDRAGYQAALAAYRQWRADRAAEGNRQNLRGITAQLQSDFSTEYKDPAYIDLLASRQRIAALREAGRPAADVFGRLVDGEEKRRLLLALDGLPVEQVRRAADAVAATPGGHGDAPPEAATAVAAKTVGTLLDEFLAAQRQRLERRQKLDQLQADGQAVRESPGQNLSAGRFAAIARDVAAMKKVVADEAWDGSEAAAARAVRRFRDASDALVLAGTHSPHSFNDRIKLARMFCAWAEATYRLDRLPRDRNLFAKYSTSQSTAKAIPLDTLRKLWDASDDRGRCWLLLGLNCGYYAADISELTAEMIDGRYLNHVRIKTGVRVKYALWPTTQRYLMKFTKGGRVFATDTGKPLVHYATLKKSGEPVRVDNVRNWFYRLCLDQDVKGFSFSNVRDTASTEVDKIDKAMNDLFLAHRDPRMAALYVDGEMVDSGPLQRVTDELGRRLAIWRQPSRSRK